MTEVCSEFRHSGLCIGFELYYNSDISVSGRLRKSHYGTSNSLYLLFDLDRILVFLICLTRMTNVESVIGKIEGLGLISGRAVII